MFSGKRRAVPGSTTTAAAAPAPPSPTKRPVTTTTTTTTTTTKKLIRRAIAPLPTDPNRPKSVNKYVPPPRIPAPSAPPEDRRPAKRARPSASSSSPASFRRPSPAAATAAVFNRGDPSSDLDPLTPSEAEEEGGDAEADSDLSSADEDYSSRTIRREDGAAVAVRNVAAPIPASDDGRIRVTSAESLVLQNPTAYRPYFTDPADPQKPASDWAGSDIPTVELQYPGEGGSERFALLAPRSDDEYNPIEDVMSVILTVLDHFLTPDQASQYFGHAPGKTAFSAFLYNRASPSTGGGGGGSGGGSGRNSRAGTPLVPPPTALRPAAAVAAAARGRSPALPARADSPAQLELSASSTKTGPPEAVASVDPIADGDAAAAHSVRGDAHVPESKTAADPQAGAPTPAPPPLPPPTPHLPYHHHHQQQQQHQQHQHPQGGESLIRQLEKARSKSDGPAFLAALERYNATLSALKRDGTVRAHVEGMRGLRERVWTRVFTQCYDRAVGPGLDAVKKYRAFSDNVYGELLPKFMNEIFARTHLGPNSVFVDLGSGVGNCVVQAALATGAESWGFENMPHASQLARAQVVATSNSSVAMFSYSLRAPAALRTSHRCFSVSSRRSADANVLCFLETKVTDKSDMVPAALNAITASKKIGGKVTGILVGKDEASMQPAIDKAKKLGLDSILVRYAPALEHVLAEPTAPVLAELIKKGGYTHFAGPHSALGKNIFPRVAGLLQVQQISDVMSISAPDTFTRPVYAGNAISTVRSKDDIKLFTVRASTWEPAQEGDKEAPVDVKEAENVGPEQAEWVSEEIVKSERPDLSSAPIVVSGGRGVKSKDAFDSTIIPLADALGAAIGASRAAVDSGYADNSLQVGQTGKVIAPELYVAVGISGAIQHLAGMKDSKTIVAINKDADAPIFQVADVGLVADLFEAVPELTKKIEAAKQ